MRKPTADCFTTQRLPMARINFEPSMAPTRTMCADSKRRSAHRFSSATFWLKTLPRCSRLQHGRTSGLRGGVIGQPLEGVPTLAKFPDGVRQGPEGAIYVLTDEDDGQILRLVQAPHERLEPE